MKPSFIRYLFLVLGTAVMTLSIIFFLLWVAACR